MKLTGIVTCIFPESVPINFQTVYMYVEQIKH